MPATAMVLVNPNIPLPTPPVFKARTEPFTPANRLPTMPKSAHELAAQLQLRVNDLQAPAISICPTIQDVLSALQQHDDCLLARLSGSGATCFALYADAVHAQKAAQEIRAVYPAWWVAVTGFGG
jgi:4-diphosphocytidyl-2-C-methyl-D-erythritol kinase